MSARARWTLAAAALAVAFWAGTKLAAHDAPAAAPVRERVVERAGPTVVRSVEGLTRDDLRAVVREELAARDGAGNADGAAVDAKAARARSPEIQAALSAGRSVVADGVQRGHWSDAERAAMRPQLAQLTGDEQVELLLPLVQAINAQQVKIDGPIL